MHDKLNTEIKLGIIKSLHNLKLLTDSQFKALVNNLHTQAELKRREVSAELKSKYSNRYRCSGKIICAECGSRFVNRLGKFPFLSVFY